jgi:glucan 1,3-beta-glucosidase
MGKDRDWMQDVMYEAIQYQHEDAWLKVLQSISWTAKYGIGVLVDLHGGPGPQNGTSFISLLDMFSDIL